MNGVDGALRARVGVVAALVILVVYGGLALTVDFRAVAGGFHSDGATYHLMAHSLAADGDLEYRDEDLARAFREFPSGPAGIFLKRGVDVEGLRPIARPPFVQVLGRPDPDASRLYFGKSFVYPLAAAPFVWLLGTNGFLLLNALLLTAAFVAIYAFTSARSGVATGLLWASAFIFASVVPVYVVWTAPELFNWSLAVVAYFVWLYKVGAPDEILPAGSRWRHPATDLAAAALIGLLTFSKVTNLLLLVPLAGWLLWQRAWSRAAGVVAAWALVTTVFFGANVAVTGDWNYQGGDRATCYDTYPFQEAGRGLDVCAERGRGEALFDTIFDPDTFGPYLRANLGYFVTGRNSGLLPYYFPVVFAVGALLITVRRRREAWQWVVLGGIGLQILLFVVTLPYSYFGGGGTVGNRYFMAVYGSCAFLLPVIRTSGWMAVPWAVGSLFVAQLILSPFQASIRPNTHVKHGLFRMLPVELTNLNDLPLMTEGSRVRIWYGDTGTNPGFQIYYLDDNSYLQEADRLSFWTRGESRAQFLIKADQPYSQLRLTLGAGAVPTEATVRLNGRTTRLSLTPGQTATIQLPLGPGFPYKKERETPAYVWTMEVGSSQGFVPAMTAGSPDRRYLGVRVTPIIVR